MENLINERCLTFKYSGSDKINESHKLAELLRQKGIDFVCYLGDDYYSCEFIVRRCGNKWNDIMKLINSIHATKYSYVRSNFYIDNNLERNLGNMQEVAI